MLHLVLGMAKRVSIPSMASKRRVVVICAALAAITWLVFGQTMRHQFVTYDDPQYVYENAKVVAGLSLEGVAWAFTHTIAGNWHPLTTVSHMFDCQLFGVNPGNEAAGATWAYSRADPAAITHTPTISSRCHQRENTPHITNLRSKFFERDDGWKDRDGGPCR